METRGHGETERGRWGEEARGRVGENTDAGTRGKSGVIANRLVCEAIPVG
jgi:hypothetical protein